MERTFRIAALTIGLAAFTVLAIVGFAIWVFIPLMPAGMIVALAIYSTRRRRRHSEDQVEKATDYHLEKAA